MKRVETCATLVCTGPSGGVPAAVSEIGPRTRFRVAWLTMIRWYFGVSRASAKSSMMRWMRRSLLRRRQIRRNHPAARPRRSRIAVSRSGSVRLEPEAVT